jgi:hypothetical protein
MKVVYYLGIMLFGLIGMMGTLRTLELLIVGAGLFPTQLLLGVVMLGLAFFCYRKVRATT